MMKGRFIAALAALSVLVSCGRTKEPELQTRKFPTVKVPSMITDRDEVMQYMAMHWWDGFADTTGTYLCDSTHILGVENGDMEQAVSNFSAALENMPADVMRKAVCSFYDRIASLKRHDPSDTTFEAVKRIYDRYLYDPNSPVRDEDLYLPFCECLASSDLLSPEERDIYAYDAKMCSLNRRGTPAADFSFSDRYGKIRTLYSIKADLTLLFFSNPGCHACKEIIDNLNSMPEVSRMIASGKLAVVNVYIDEDLTAWYDYMPIYPTTWYNGYDPNLVIRTDLLYNVRAIPSLYILDKDKKVIMKDAPESRVFDCLYRASQQD